MTRDWSEESRKEDTVVIAHKIKTNEQGDTQTQLPSNTKQYKR